MIDMTNIKNIIFDIGSVLLEYRWEDMLMDHGLSREDAIKIGTAMFTDPLWSGMDLSSTGEEQAIIESYHRKYPEYGDTIEWFINHCEYMHVPREDVWERVHKSRLQRRPSGKMPVKAGLYISRRKCYNNKLCNCVSREEADPWRFCRGCWTT